MDDLTPSSSVTSIKSTPPVTESLSAAFSAPAWNCEGDCAHAEAVPPSTVLRNEPLYRIFKATSQAFRERALHQMREEGIQHLYPGAVPLLMHLNEEDGLTLSELARRCNLENSTLTPLVDELERAELACRRRDPEDRRLVRIHLTSAGREMAPRLHRVWAQVQEQALNGIGDDQLTALHTILARIVTNLTAGDKRDA